MHVTLVGLGNIGSHAAEFLARNASVTAVTLIDHDVYEQRNTAGQAIRSSDVGKEKASVHARRLQEIREEIRIDAICDRVENLPLGRLKCDVLAAAVDTRITRQYLNEACWSLGIPWVDSGVSAESGLASISVYEPAPENACIECNWTDRHYATLEVEYPCGSNRPAVNTNAPASLGGLAGALLAIECGKLISPEKAPPTAGHQVVYDTLWRKHHVVTLWRNPRCRFSHHTLPTFSSERR
jgi:adenylyltransferase/sulfurtransferase